jgi:hypothetical protein
MVDAVLFTDELAVFSGPDQVEVQLDYGPSGDRGSLIFVANGQPDEIDWENEIGQDAKLFDLFINLDSQDTDNEYLMIYQYREALGTTQWQPLTKLIPNTYAKNDIVNFNVENASYIPIADIVDPSYVGSVNASNFSVQATFATSTGYPIVSSIKTEVIEATLTEPAKLKITFYAKEFDGTNWIDIVGSRTVNLHISVV